MNERIRELVKQAGGHFSTRNLMSNPVQHRESIELWDDRIEKFAELIVRECAQVAFEGDLKRAIGQWGADSDILKHFEVEHDVVKTFRSKE